LLNMVFFSLKKVLHHVEVTLDQNIELSEVTPLKGKGFGREERGIGGKGMDIREGRKDYREGKEKEKKRKEALKGSDRGLVRKASEDYQSLRTKILHMGLMPPASKLCVRH
jgi:hypothetical protein